MNGGAVESINRSTYPRARELNTKSSNPWTYSTYTVFVQQNNGNILAVDFDARRKDLRDSEIQEWRDIGFHHMTANNSVFTYLDAPGDHTHLAAGSPTNSATWINQLFPQQYHSNPGPSAPYPSLRHAGLIGRLPLIFTLAALSCAQHQVDFIFTHCIGPRRWTVHNVGHNSTSFRALPVNANLLTGSQEKGSEAWSSPSGETQPTRHPRTKPSEASRRGISVPSLAFEILKRFGLYEDASRDPEQRTDSQVGDSASHRKTTCATSFILLITFPPCDLMSSTSDRNEHNGTLSESCFTGTSAFSCFLFRGSKSGDGARVTQVDFVRYGFGVGASRGYDWSHLCITRVFWDEEIAAWEFWGRKATPLLR